MPQTTLSAPERLHYRDRFRAARYAALADAEGFGEICFAIEALGLRIHGKEASMGKYRQEIDRLAKSSIVLYRLPEEFPALFTRFQALYEAVRDARNDAMHTGVYARHTTTAAIELCIGLEEALMVEEPIVGQSIGSETDRETVADFMVKAPVIVEPWHPVAYARQLMLMHSFSFLPVHIGEWKLVSEVSMARYLHEPEKRKNRLATQIEKATKEENGLELIPAKVVEPTANVIDLLKAKDECPSSAPMLWLVGDRNDRLCGVLSAFELM